MASDAQTAGLYDFLYRDSARVASYYAQIFGGKLVAVESSDNNRDVAESTGKLGVPSILAGEKRVAKETATGVKRTTDPHDVNITDVLSALKQAGRIGLDITSAAPGSLVRVTGTLTLLHSQFLETSSSFVEVLIGIEKKKHGRDRNQAQIQILEQIAPLFKKLHLPSAFLLEPAEGKPVVGTVKDEAMEESVASFHVKHGMEGLPDIHVIGIKEISRPIVEPGNLFNVSQQIAKQLSAMVFPPEAIRMTPIAIFREICHPELS